MIRKVSIIVLTWNCLSHTKQCLDSLFSNTKFDNYDVIVVDNGSTDGSLEYLASLDSIRLIKNGKNLGFTKGNNIGITAAADNDVVLLNNDMIIIHEDWLERLQQVAYSARDIGIVGCRLINENGMLLHAGTFIYPETYWGQQIGGGQRDIKQFNSIREVEGIVFACAYIKREVVESVGLLDEDYFAYFEDTDYCFKAKEKGFKTVCSGDVTLIHYQNVATAENKVSFHDLFKKSQRTFISKWGRSLSNKYSHKIAWHSIVNFPSGYAISSKNIMVSLDKKGIDVRYKYVYGQGTPFPVEENKTTDNYIVNVIKQRPFSNAIPQVVYGQGDIFHKNDGRYKIGYTMLEVSGIPKAWVDSANRMDEIWVPSRFNAETFRNSGVKVPIYTIPLGIDPDFFNPEIKSYKEMDEFIFLSVFEWGERKDPAKLLRAYANEFKKKENVLLVCRVINNDASVNVPHEIKNLNLPGNRPLIVFIYNQPVSGYHRDVIFIHGGKIPDHELGALYRSADCFVLPTRGEGWGMPILEAMACGLPVITTNWSAQTEFINEQNAYLLGVARLIDAKAKCPYYAGFQWADTDEEHLMYLMRLVYEHQEEAKEKGAFASREVLAKWTWDNTADKILQRLKKSVDSSTIT